MQHWLLQSLAQEDVLIGIHHSHWYIVHTYFLFLLPYSVQHELEGVSREDKFHNYPPFEISPGFPHFPLFPNPTNPPPIPVLQLIYLPYSKLARDKATAFEPQLIVKVLPAPRCPPNRQYLCSCYLSEANTLPYGEAIIA